MCARREVLGLHDEHTGVDAMEQRYAGLCSERDRGDMAHEITMVKRNASLRYAGLCSERDRESMLDNGETAPCADLCNERDGGDQTLKGRWATYKARMEIREGDAGWDRTRRPL